MVTILGITSPNSLNPAACLMVGRRLVCAAEEERFVNVKSAPRFLPYGAVEFCLRTGDVTPDDVDVIAIAHCSPSEAEAQISRFHGHIDSGENQWSFDPERHYHSTYLYGLHKLYRRFSSWRRKSMFVPHHIAHAASAFFFSPFAEAAVLTLDGRGESSSGLLIHADNGNLRVIKEFPIGQSLGLLYESVTQHLGFRRHQEEGTVMALAALAEVDEGLAGVESDDGTISLDWARITEFHGVPCRDSTAPIEPIHAMLAARLQYSLEEAVLSLLSSVPRSTPLCLSGGVFLNCKLNGRILEEWGRSSNVFVQPASSDAGTALGAAAFALNELTGERPDTMRVTQLGPAYSSQEILRYCSDSKVLSVTTTDDLVSETAALLVQGRVVGWFNGRMEFGPRALGSRSILADPTAPGMKDRLNRIKGRFQFRPFAPSILAERAADFFPTEHPLPFMNIAVKVNTEKAQRIAEACHIDWSCRPQLVSRQDLPVFAALLESFESTTGLPVLVNTSFNRHGCPIPRTPKDALAAFFTMGVDVLAMENVLVTKN